MKIVTDEYARDSLQSELEDWKPKRVSKGKRYISNLSCNAAL